VVGWVTCSLVDALDRFPTGRLGQAEDRPGVRISPCAYETQLLLVLDREVCRMCRGEGAGVIPTIPVWTSMNSGMVNLLQ
jgi:hypothetical protein